MAYKNYYAALISFTLFLQIYPIVSKSGLPLFYWKKSTNSENFGDRLSLELVKRIVRKPINYAHRTLHKKKLLAIGSILRAAHDNDVVWGSGINGKSLDNKTYSFNNLDIRAVRGPLTREFLVKEFGISCPAVYGDPALLMPYFFPEFKKPRTPKYPYLIVPHYSEEHLFPKDHYPFVVYPTEPWHVVVEKIINSAFVISSSLHGIVVAEAYNIPARLLKITWTEPLFKYADYYYGTQRYNFAYAESIEEALKMGGEPPAQCDVEALYNAFPKDFWPKKRFKRLKKRAAK